MPDGRGVRARARVSGLDRRLTPSCYTGGLRGFAPLLLRDLAITAVAAALIGLDATLAQEGTLAIVVGALAGLSAAVVAFLVHEWGHLVGTFLSGGVAHPARSLASVFLFSFDVAKSDRRQFLAMSYGGYLATAIAVVPLAGWIDVGRTSGVVGTIASVLGIGATLVLEIPTTVKVARGGPLPTGGVYEGTPS